MSPVPSRGVALASGYAILVPLVVGALILLPQSSCRGDMIGSCGIIAGVVLLVAAGVFGGSLALWVMGGHGGFLTVILALGLGVVTVPASFPWRLAVAVPLALLYWRTLADLLDHRLESAITLVTLGGLATWVLVSEPPEMAFPAGVGAAGLVVATLRRRAIAHREAANPSVLHSRPHGGDREE